MTTSPRLPLDVLVTEYMLHIDRRDLYVEGRDDRAVLEWFLESVSVSNVRVLEIDSVEITAEDLRRHNLNEGVKSRVLVLARELDNTLPENTPQVLCIVDADFDYLLDRIESNRFLAYTDGTSLEMYAFSETALKRVLRLGFRDPDSDPEQILNALYGILREIFVTRAANEALRLGLEWLPYERRCKIQAGGTIAFDVDRFVQEYLSKNGALAGREEFSRCRAKLLTRTINSRVRYIRGHDYALLLTRYLRATCRTREARDLARGEAIIRMLFVALDPEEMRTEPLFQRIIDQFV